jgi:hypothetical protein
MRIRKGILFSTSFFLFVVPFIFYIVFFSGPIISDDQKWANFGTYFGGVVSPVFTFLSFIVVILVYYESNEDKKDETIRQKFFQYMEYMNKCYSHIECNTPNVSIVGEKVFSSFNGLAFEINKFPKVKIEPQKEFPFDDNGKSRLISYIFFRNSIMPFVKIVKTTIHYIEKQKSDLKRDFYDLLDSQLSEQNRISYAILMYDSFDKTDAREMLYENTPIEGYLDLGKNVGEILEINEMSQKNIEIKK